MKYFIAGLGSVLLAWQQGLMPTKELIILGVMFGVMMLVLLLVYVSTDKGTL